MSPTAKMEEGSMNRRTYAILVMSMLLTALLTGVTHASNAPIEIDFVKDCPAYTCSETAASPVDVYTEITSAWFSGSVLHYTATETLSSGAGSVTIDFVGMANYLQDPTTTVLRGTVTSGSWNGVALAGARVFASAARVSGTTFAGSVRIMPGSAE